MRRTAAQFLIGIALVAGCSSDPTAPTPEQRDIAALRTATDAFHNIDAAKTAGFDNQFPAGCFTSNAGGMGVHWMRDENVGTLSVSAPQLIMYEPQADHSMKLVGVEFIAPGAPTDTPPVLFGQTFKWNATFQVWALHVWAWKDNPQGMYADYNPQVTCAHATVVATRAHH